jgi:hypothetical protein
VGSSARDKPATMTNCLDSAVMAHAKDHPNEMLNRIMGEGDATPEVGNGL